MFASSQKDPRSVQPLCLSCLRLVLVSMVERARDLAHGLACVCVNDDIGISRFGEAGQTRDIVHRADLVIGQHQGDQASVCAESGLLATDTKRRDVHAWTIKPGRCPLP